MVAGQGEHFIHEGLGEDAREVSTSIMTTRICYQHLCEWWQLMSIMRGTQTGTVGNNKGLDTHGSKRPVNKHAW